ncbi:LacI family DNA-binding transcriptional regulator [Paenisporosarcina indica]|uniref:LacI family DNA-binding transcriptional regulator n=1 Tax=Paenisporosarcina indica TaxID=650093 RepID=UPI00094FDC1A|nr:LacI family DNA-binding transcriptional regulator [Paenisporosarcina indica]
MKKNVTIRDVAKEAGLSIATVSRHLNGKGSISEQAEKKIKDVMARLDYKPNEIARSLSNRKTNTIALIIPDITNPFFPELVVSIEGLAKEKGYNLVLINTQEEVLHSNGFWRNLESRFIDGLILVSFQFTGNVLKGMENMNLPFVRIDRAAEDDENNSFGVDNHKGARLAVEHLIEVGCKKIAHISGPNSYPSSSERLKGYAATIERYFPKQKTPVYEGDFSLESGQKLTKQLMTDYPNCDGIFLANDLMAIGALKTLKLMNIRVPEDVAIIGFDGIKLTEMVAPEISTIEQPIFELGAMATTHLIDMIEKKNVNSEYTKLDVQLRKRESTLGYKKGQE